MRAFIQLIALASGWFLQTPQTASEGPFREQAHRSGVMGAVRPYRVLLPRGYERSQQRYPVVYWFRTEDRPVAARDARMAAWAASRDVIVVDVPGVSSQGPFPLYFQELVDQIDVTLRTIADRGHRGIAGIGTAGYAAYIVAGKYPDVVGSVAAINGATDGYAGPDAFPVACRLDDLAGNYDGTFTRMSNSTADSLAYYHRRLASFWTYTRPGFEYVSFLAGQDLEEVVRTLDFFVTAFSKSPLQPAMFNHSDAEPNFEVWGWDIVSNRRQPGYTVLENVSNAGFRSAVREYLPGGAAIPQVTLSIGSPAIYPPGVALSVTYIRLLDGKVRRADQRVDAHGRLNFDLDGGAYEVAVSSSPLLTVSGYAITGANWATAGKPVSLQVRFWNKGGAPAGTTLIRWESANPGVKFATPQGRLNALAPGESANLPVTFTVDDPQRAIVRIFAVAGLARMPLDVPLFPAAEPSSNFQIADGRTVNVFQHATQKADVRLGEGNGDGHAAPGESFAILLPESGGLRPAEVFTNDACVENNMRGSDSWPDYEHAGASVNYSLPSIRLDCEPGHVVHLLAREIVPGPSGDAQVKFATVEFPVWNRSEAK